MNDDAYIRSLERLVAAYNRLNIMLETIAVSYLCFLFGCFISYCIQSSMINKATRHIDFFVDLNGIIEI